MLRSLWCGSALLMLLLACGCSKPPPPEKERPPEPQAPGAVSQAIREPIDKAKGVEGELQDAAAEQRAAIDEQTQ